MELRDSLKKTGFIKASRINQGKKPSQQKVKKIPTGLSASIYASRLLDKHFILYWKWQLIPRVEWYFHAETGPPLTSVLCGDGAVVNAYDLKRIG